MLAYLLQSSPRGNPIAGSPSSPRSRDQLPKPQIVHYSLLCLKLEFPPPGPTCGLVFISLWGSGHDGPTERGRGPWLLADTASLDFVPPAAPGSAHYDHLQPGLTGARPKLFLLNWPLSCGSNLCPPSILTDVSWTMNMRLQGASPLQRLLFSSAPVTEPGTPPRLSSPPTASKVVVLVSACPQGY